MVQKGLGVEELAERLNEIGVQISAGGLASKISRAGFSFFPSCLGCINEGRDYAGPVDRNIAIP